MQTEITLLWAQLLIVWALSPFPLNFRLFTKPESHNKTFIKYLQNIYSVFSPIFLLLQPNQAVQIQHLCQLIYILRQTYNLLKDRWISKHIQDKKMQSLQEDNCSEELITLLKFNSSYIYDIKVSQCKSSMQQWSSNVYCRSKENLGQKRL